MTQVQNDTKQALVLAAGELFADHGFDGTSVRAIADKAGANVAAINYHFGSKEALYVETLRYVIQCDKVRPVREFVQANTGEASVEDVEKVLVEASMESLKSLTSTDRPQWRFHFLMRTMFEPVVDRLNSLIDETFRPDVEDLMALARRVVPGLPDRDALRWSFGFMGHIAFYMFVRRPVLRVLGQEDYNPQFLREAGEFAAASAVATLEALRAEHGVAPATE